MALVMNEIKKDRVLNISPNGSWLNDNAEGHIFDPALADGIIEFCKEKRLLTVMDLGCGPGYYIHTFTKADLLASGRDGNPHTYELTKGAGYYRELHTPLKEIEVKYKFDLVLSLEVGEHIPQEFEQVFLDNIVRSAKKWIILSWAVPGQKGDGHVNCRSNQYIINEMLDRNYTMQLLETQQLRKKSTAPWFKNSLMCFKQS